MLLEHVGGAVEMRDPHDDDLAEATIELRLEASRADKIEPDRGQRRRVEQQPIDIDQRAAATGADLGDEVSKLGVILFLKIGDAGHFCSVGASGSRRMAGQRLYITSSAVTRCRAAPARTRRPV